MRKAGQFLGAAILLICGIFFATVFFENAIQTKSASAQPTHSPAGETTSESAEKLGFFDYQDATHDFKARVYLPESLGQWFVENPWRGADESLIPKPKLYVKANFQSKDVPKFHGLIRVVYDLDGTNCGVLFSRLGQSDGLSLEKYTASDIKGVDEGKLYLFDFYGKKDNLSVTSKVVCDKKSAMELMVIAPNEDQYLQAIATIIGTVDMHIPAIPPR